MPLDGFLAKREAESVAGVFFPVETPEHLEYAALERRVYTRPVIFDGEDALEIDAFG